MKWTRRDFAPFSYFDFCFRSSFLFSLLFLEILLQIISRRKKNKGKEKEFLILHNKKADDSNPIFVLCCYRQITGKKFSDNPINVHFKTFERSDSFSLSGADRILWWKTIPSTPLHLFRKLKFFFPFKVNTVKEYTDCLLLAWSCMVGDSSFSYHPRMSGTSQSGKRPPRELTAASRGGARGVRAAWSVHRAFADLGDQPERH